MGIKNFPKDPDAVLDLVGYQVPDGSQIVPFFGVAAEDILFHVFSVLESFEGSGYVGVDVFGAVYLGFFGEVSLYVCPAGSG